jgi:HAD superfamily hydrolase (TIGR01509 family)
MRRFDLVIFDCDGVVIDSETIAIRADSESYQAAGFPVTPADIQARYMGTRESDTLADIEHRFGRPFPPGFAQRLRAHRAAVFEAELQPMPGIGALLDRLEIPYCVASSSSPARLAHSLRLTALYDRFAPNIFSATEVAHGKPAPDIFLFAAKRMAVAPSRALVIEDSVPGIVAAKAAGMTGYGFVGGSHAGPDQAGKLTAAGADAVLASMSELTLA